MQPHGLRATEGGRRLKRPSAYLIVLALWLSATSVLAMGLVVWTFLPEPDRDGATVLATAS